MRGGRPHGGGAGPSISEDAPLVQSGLDQQTALWPPRRMEVQPWRERLSAHSNLETWEFPGWGNNEVLRVTPEQLEAAAKMAEAEQRKLVQLNAFESTSICANDLLSAPLYVVGLVTAAAGKLAPVALLLVAGVLYLIRGMYGEAISALPLDGGAFNVLMNTSTKPFATFAATLALISYTATAVVSASTAIDYLQQAFPTDLPDVPCTILLLGALGLLRVLGIRVTAICAQTADIMRGPSNGVQVIFVLHLITLVALCIACMAYMTAHPSVFQQNMQSPYPDVDVAGETKTGTFWTAIFFGFSWAVLGISGYETSAQFVQDQGPGVFIKTLENMWHLVLVFNPLIALLALGVTPLSTMRRDEYTVLAQMAHIVGSWMMPGAHAGRLFEKLVCGDAFVVLCGAVLSAHVGVSGLVRRMAADRCLPEILLQRNKWFGTTHNIPFAFFIVNSILVVMLQDNVTSLSGVYRLSFLSVLLIFSIGVMVLKFKRPTLPRDVTLPWGSVVLGFLMILVGFTGNMIGRPQELSIFLSVVCIGGLAVFSMFQRKAVIRGLVRMLRKVLPFASRYIQDELTYTRTTPACFFIKNDDVYLLNKALLYVTDNEDTQRLLVVHCYDKDHTPPPALAKHVATLDTIYPRIQTTFLAVEAPFGPAVIEWLSKELLIPKNMMFIACPADTFKHRLSEFRGEIRIITANPPVRQNQPQTPVITPRT